MTDTTNTPGITYSYLMQNKGVIPLDVRLLRKSVPNKDTGCLEYKGNNDRYGYGKIKVAGRQLGAHRIAYVVFVGDIPPNTVVMHKCDNPCCINTDHLMLGSQKQNISDAAKKGRLKFRSNSGYKRGDYNKPICLYNDEVSIIYRSPVTAILDGFSCGAIYDVLNKKRQSLNGFKAYYLQQAIA